MQVLTEPGMESTRLKEHEDVSILIEKIKAGDREAFRELVLLYQKKVFVLAFSFFRNREDALDTVQETFLRLHEKIAMYEKGKNFQGWLMQIAKNLCVDYYRRNHGKRKEMESDQSLDNLQLVAPTGRDAERSLDLKRLFDRCTGRLAEKQRLVFVMKHYNEFQYNEIAQILQIREGTVKSLHFKALQNMRKLMRPYLGVQT